MFIDLSAAFDRVIREWVFRNIRVRIPDTGNTKIIDLLECFYDDTSAFLAIDPNCEIFQTDIGVAQGGVEALPLFCLFIDFVMRVYEHQLKEATIAPVKFSFSIPEQASTPVSSICDVTHGGLVRSAPRLDIPPTRLSWSKNKKPPDKNVTGLNEEKWNGYADDTTIYQLSESDLQQALLIVSKIYRRYGLNLNVGKTKTMIYGIQAEDTPASIIKLGKTTVENLENFRFLGSKINDRQYSTGVVELNSRIQSAESKYAEYRKILKNPYLSLATRLRYFTVFIRSRLSYACHHSHLLLLNINAWMPYNINFYDG